MKKADRQKVFDKYGGKCAYSGKELPDDWQIDHAVPKRNVYWLLRSVNGVIFDVNHADNLLPALKILNHYKRDRDIKEWKRFLLTFHERLARVPKNPRCEKRIKYKNYMLSVAEAFGITPDKPFSGVFYFETLTADRSN